ncbi:MAG: nitrite/sulfite reductase, partial [Dehalococcoidia bacterium]|nr:nitrite/sulfite reductase [Dehalococcoidia bacterium]
FKVAFTATDADEAITGIHDIGFIPRIENGVRGFKMVVGGGLSIMPREAPVLNEFTPVDEYLKVSEAIIRIFDRADELRKNRAKARIKFLIDRVGIEEFRRMVDEELKGDWTNKDFSPDRLLFVDDEEATAPARRDSYTQPAREDRDAFTYFVQSNVKAQRQQGFSTVQVKVTRGDLTPKQFHGLADILRDYCGGRARTSIHQNLVLRWVRDESLYEVFSRLRDLGLADAGADSVTDVVSCPGTDSCKLGITSSMGLNRAIQERVVSMKITDERTRKIHIKMSGCPNSCGQHHIANIGFHGAVIKVEGHEMPAYHVFIGGNYDGGKLRLARQLKVRLPAKRGPETVERFLKLYQLDRQGNEEFNDFVDRVGPQPFQDAIADLVVPGEFDDENQSMFIDWGKSQLYKMERGEGECAI